MQSAESKESKWHLPMKGEVYPTIDASTFCKQIFEDMSNYLIKKVRKNEVKRS